MRAEFSGTGVALATPFQSNGSIDFTGFRKLLRHVIEGGVSYLVVLGSTGEAATISPDEKRELVSFVIEQVNGTLPIVVGFSDNDTHRLLREIERFDFNGVSAILSASPAYNKPNQKGIYQHYKAIAAASPVSVILYNVPGRTASNMAAETVLRLAGKKANIVAVKEASGNFTQCMELVKGNSRKDFAIVSGDDLYTLPLVGAGFDGVISVIANAFPAQFSQMVNLALEGNFEKAQQLHYQLFEIINLIFEDGNPAGIKAVLEVLGICDSHLRLPLVNVDKTLRHRLTKAVKNLLKRSFYAKEVLSYFWVR